MEESLSAKTISHYRILSLLGAGGMGEVYLAQDTRLKRKVALKLLPAQLTSNLDRVRRFEQEAEAASALNHPNIITIYEIGQAEGAHFIATEYIEGETLRQRLGGEPLKLSAALEVATQIASALSAAHTSGIMHRDIKPENVMLRPDGLVKVLDFGLAKLTEQRINEVDTNAPTVARIETDPGTVMGTVSYMSPEQARGLKVDARSDIFSLGVVLYEILAGHRPFEGSTASHVIVEILEKEPAPLAQYSPDVPAELERIVSKMLAKDRGERYQSAKDVHIDLKRLQQRLEIAAELERTGQPAAREGMAETRNREPAVAVKETAALTGDAAAQSTSRAALLRSQVKSHKRGAAVALALSIIVVGGIGFGAYRLATSSERTASQTKPAEAQRALRSVAVLPFKQLSPGGDDDYLALGVADALITRLSNLSQIIVRPTDAVAKYAAPGQDQAAAGRELGVDLLLTGRMQRAGERIRVTVQLVSVQDGHPVWAEQFDEKFTDLFTVEDAISQKVAQALTLRLSREEQQRLTKRYTENAAAYQEYLKGRFYTLQYTPDGFKQAVAHLNQAIALDPTYALAFAGLADAHTAASEWLLPPREAMAKAKAAALKALSFDDTLAEAHAALGHVKVHELDRSADVELQRALELNPNSVTTLLWYTEFFMPRDSAKAVSTMQRAQQLDPLSSTVLGFLSGTYLLAHQVSPALKAAKDEVELDPNNPNSHCDLGKIYESQGNYPEALAEYEKAKQLAPLPVILASIGRVYARMGKRQEAQQVIAELHQLSGKQYVSPFDFATIYIALGEKDQAFAWLDKAYEDRSEWLGFMPVDFRVDAIRSDPRYAALLRRIGLTP